MLMCSGCSATPPCACVGVHLQTQRDHMPFNHHSPPTHTKHTQIGQLVVLGYLFLLIIQVVVNIKNKPQAVAAVHHFCCIFFIVYMVVFTVTTIMWLIQDSSGLTSRVWFLGGGRGWVHGGKMCMDANCTWRAHSHGVIFTQ